MPALQKSEFTEDDWDEVQSFECGDKPHQKAVSNWLKQPLGEDGALTFVCNEQAPGKVWLYRLDDENESLVGYGALGKGAWRWTGNKDPRVPVTLVIWFAVQTQFKRQPDGPEDGFYSSLIMDDLIAEAYDDEHTHPVLGLCVDPVNVGAIALYVRKKFDVELSPYKDREAGIDYRRMARVLNADVLARLRDEAKKSK